MASSSSGSLRREVDSIPAVASSPAFVSDHFPVSPAPPLLAASCFKISERRTSPLRYDTSFLSLSSMTSCPANTLTLLFEHCQYNRAMSALGERTGVLKTKRQHTLSRSVLCEGATYAIPYTS